METELNKNQERKAACLPSLSNSKTPEAHGVYQSESESVKAPELKHHRRLKPIS
jgi:hypothetical protein